MSTAPESLKTAAAPRNTDASAERALVLIGQLRRLEVEPPTRPADLAVPVAPATAMSMTKCS
jgi:hypothetical protein